MMDADNLLDPAEEPNLHRQEEIRRKDGKCIHRGGEDNVYYAHDVEVKTIGEQIKDKGSKLLDKAKQVFTHDDSKDKSGQESTAKD